MVAKNSSQEAVFKSSAGLQITITDGDILAMPADTLVTREYSHFYPESDLCQSFCRKAGISTTDWIHGVKQVHRKIETNTVICKDPGKHCVPYTHVFHAIVDSYKLSIKDLEKLYLDVLHKAEKFYVQSLAMPLLDRDNSHKADILMKCLAKHEKRHLKNVYIGASCGWDFQEMCDSGQKYLTLERYVMSCSTTTFETVTMTNSATKKNLSVRAAASYGDSAVVSDEVRSIPTRKEDMIKFESFTFNSKLKVVICHGDIFKSGTQALLTGENRELFPLSSDWKRYCLSKRMSEEQWKTDFKRKHVFIRHSEVYMDPRPIHECFKYVFHAIVYPYHAYGERTWLNEMKKLYENVVRETEIYASSIAMPLLMTENVPRGYAVDAAVQSLAKIKTTLKEVHIYVPSLDDFDIMCKSCWKHEVRNVYKFVDKLSSSAELVMDLPAPTTRDEPNSSGAVGDDVEPTGNNLASRRDSWTHEFQSLPSERRSVRRGDADDTKPIGKRAESNTIGAVGGVDPTGNYLASASKAKHFIGNRRRDKSQMSDGSRNAGTGGDQNTSGTDDDEDVPQKMATSVKDATTMSSTEADDTCPICMDSISNPKKLSKCGHVFCKDCIDRCFKTFKPVCPTCNTIYGEITGTQPKDLSSQTHDSSHPSREHQLENGLMFTVHLEDILKVGADAVVTGESPDLSTMSLVTQKLCESGGIRYNVWRDGLLVRHRRRKFGKVYETFTSITDLPYRYSFHAIMYVYRSGYDMEWATGMDEIYSNIVKKAEEKALRSVVMPLLGSGRAGVPVELTIDVLLKSLSSKSRNHLKEVHLAVVDKKIYDMVVKECQNLNSQPAPEPKEAWVSNNTLVEPQRSQQATNNALIPASYVNTGMAKDSSSNTSRLGEPMHEMDTNGPGSDGRSTPALPPESPPISSFDIIDDICVICIDIVCKPKILDKCGHVFCCGCIDKCFEVFKPVCPICNTIYGVIIGNQPPGNMTVKHEPYSLPGHSDCGTIKMIYHFNSGVQGPEHPNPGSQYHGTKCTAYLPDSPEGNKVLRLLQIAFERRVTFAIGISLTTGREDVITWNDIHHKTRCDGNAKGFGYPDPTYLSRVVEELKCKGITEADL